MYLTLVVGWSYIAIVIWAIVKSERRWRTALWLVIGWVAPLVPMMLLAIILRSDSPALGTSAALLSALCSAICGCVYTAKHRRSPSHAG